MRSDIIPAMPRVPLPEHLRDRPFARRDLDGTGVSQGRLNRRDVQRPYHGVQTTEAPSTVRERCRAYAVRLKEGQAFSHTTAALLHGLPLPQRLEDPVPLHVSCVHPAAAPRTRGVIGHRLRAAIRVQELDGLPVCVPSETWCQLAPDLSTDELIEVADHLLTVSPLGIDRTRRPLELRVRAVRREGAGRLLDALSEARAPVRSPGETRVRLLLVRAGLPEPALNARVTGSGGVVLGHGDLVWTLQRLVLEYEGDGHRTDREQFRSDIERYEVFRDAGWEVVRATADDLRGDRRRVLVERVRRRLARGVVAGLEP